MIGLLLTGSALAFAPGLPCGTLDRLRAGVPAPAVVQARIPGSADIRDAYALPNLLTSDHFAAHWGADTVSEAEVERLLAAFELAWDVVVTDMGHPAPATAEAFLFNVYLGDTGGPSSYGHGGYYTLDPEGFPMIVVAADLVRLDPVTADHAAQHEFYHAIQGSLARYEYEGAAAWYWEATAEWAAIEVDPTNASNGSFVFAYLLLPRYPVDFFDYPDSGVLEEYFQYGAFLFPHDLTRQYGYELVRDSWIEPGPLTDPLEVLRSGLAERGADLDELWLDHLAHNVVFDYDGGLAYRANVQEFGAYYPEADRITVNLEPSGGAGARIRPGLHRYGAANFRLSFPDPGRLEIRITGQPAGSLGSPARFWARVVREWPDGAREYLDVPFQGEEGALDLPDIGDEQDIWVTVGAWTPELLDARWQTEVFPFSWSIEVVDLTPDPPPATPGPVESTAPEGCGCATGGPGGWAILAGFLARRRRKLKGAR